MKEHTYKAVNKIRKRWLPIAMFVVIFSLLPIGLEYYYIKNTTSDHWFEYSQLHVEDMGVNNTDRLILVLSYAVIKRPVELNWNDVLYCKGKGGYEFVSSNQSSNFYMQPAVLPRVYINPNTGTENKTPWRFLLKEELTTGEQCYLESTITARLPYGIEKTAQIRSNTFIVQ